MQLVAGIASLDIPARFAAAQKRIILHAAVYGPFADSTPHKDGLAAALSKPSFERLDIIALDDSSAWANDFMQILRPGATRESHTLTLAKSHDYISGLAESYPDKVCVHPQSSLPCLPLIVIDDTIIFGQYAHSDVHAASGAWGIMEADVGKLLNWTAQGKIPESATAEETAAYRMIAECCHAMTGEHR